MPNRKTGAALIEEAAGTSKYKSRKIVAEKKLERTQQNLLRVNDIVREIERQIRSMELQAKKAERYRALKSELQRERSRLRSLAARSFHGRNRAPGAAARRRRKSPGRISRHDCTARRRKTNRCGCRLLEADREIGAQQETVYQRRTQIQTDEQKCEFLPTDLDATRASGKRSRRRLDQLEERQQNPRARKSPSSITPKKALSSSRCSKNPFCATRKASLRPAVPHCARCKTSSIRKNRRLSTPPTRLPI